ncbi:MAG: hypothetical protein IJ168_10495 [Eubacterium sp.]|nr:hypothetical protein [Eubacterium sp.]
MFRYYFNRLACIVLSLVLAASLVGIAVSALTVGFFKSESFLRSACERNSAELIADMEEAAADAAAVAGLPEAAFEGAVNSENVSGIASEIARMFNYGYTADYSDSKTFYNMYYSCLADYAVQNSLGLTDEEVQSAASLAVSYINYRMKGNDTKTVGALRFASGMTALYVIVACAVCLVISLVAIDLINDGRHRRFSYIGMGLNVAGYLLLFVPLAVRMTGLLEKFRFCVYGSYDSMIRDCYAAVLQWLTVIGAVLLVGGIVLLVFNYRYYAGKLERAKLSRQEYEKLQEDFMDAPKPTRQRAEGEELERHVMKIDFEE